MPLKGADILTAKLKALEQNLINEVKGLVEYHTGEIEITAIRDAPGGGDEIKTTFGSQSQKKIARGRSWTPISQAIGYSLTENKGVYRGTVYVERSAGEIAAWVEFGTGQSASSYLATVEPEWRAEAQKFYINGKGTIIGKPYLYPAYLKQRVLFVKELKEALKNIKL